MQMQNNSTSSSQLNWPGVILVFDTLMFWNLKMTRPESAAEKLTTKCWHFSIEVIYCINLYNYVSVCHVFVAGQFRFGQKSGYGCASSVRRGRRHAKFVYIRWWSQRWFMSFHISLNWPQISSNVFHVVCRSTRWIRVSPRDICPEDPRMMLTWFLHMNNMVFFCCLLALWVSELAAFSLDIVMFCVGHGHLSHKDESHSAWFATPAAFACLRTVTPCWGRVYHWPDGSTYAGRWRWGPFRKKKTIILYYILYFIILYYFILY